MLARPLFIVFCSALFLTSSMALHAQQAESVTPQNISSFSLYKAGTPGAVACRAKGAERRLGKLSISGTPSIITVGAIFTSLSPSVSQQEARLRKIMNSSTRALKRPSSSRAKQQARKRLQQVKKELALLSSYTSWCNTFVPSSSQPGGFLPPHYATPPFGDGGAGTSEPQFFIDDSGEGPTHTCSPTLVSGTVSGGGDVIVTLANESFIESQNASGGNFSFPYVPTGTYSLVAESEGASYGPAHKVIVRTDGNCQGISLARQEVPDTGAFAFRWQQQASITSGLEQSTRTSPERPAAASVSNGFDPARQAVSTQSSAADILSQRFKITLNSGDLSWSAEHAERLKLTFDTIFPAVRGPSPIQKNSVWILTSEYLPNDLRISEINDSYEVRISAEAFRYSALTPAVLDGVRGNFFSERLTLAAARFLSREGRDRAVVEQILFERYKFRIVNDLDEACSLTYRTTRECGESFQFFTNEELLELLGSIAQLPSFSDSPRPYSHLPLIRRRNGVRHPSPSLDQAKIVSYSEENLAQPYIEFAADSFLPPDKKFITDPRHPSKEILLLGMVAAYASILWNREITQELRDAWIAETGWSFDSFTRRWTNSNLTEVGASLPVGVREDGPQGDFATSVAKYVADPEELRFRSSRRFEFLKLYVMHGLRYARQFREDLKFPVLNLRPDFSYPGKVKRLEVVVSGAPEEDKRLQMTVTLEGSDPLEHGATMAWATLRHRGSSQSLHIGFYPDRPDPVYNASLVLRADTRISKYQAGGFYDLESLNLIDGVGNMRFNGHKDVGFKFFLKNVLEIPKPAELVRDSVKLSLSETLIDGVPVPMFTTAFKITNPEALRSAMDYQICLSENRSPLFSSAIARRAGDTVRISRPVSPFLPSGIYGVPVLNLSSIGSSSQYLFSADGGISGGAYLPMPMLEHESSNGDVTDPEIVLNSITVKAESLSPNNPNGATKVVVRLKARDDLSGLRSMYFCLRSPLDRSVCGIFDLRRKTELLPEGTTELKEYESIHYLPAGSAPGTWGVDSVQAEDQVGNSVYHRLSEIVKFFVDNKKV